MVSGINFDSAAALAKLLSHEYQGRNWFNGVAIVETSDGYAVEVRYFGRRPKLLLPLHAQLMHMPRGSALADNIELTPTILRVLLNCFEEGELAAEAGDIAGISEEDSSLAQRWLRSWQKKYDKELKLIYEQENAQHAEDTILSLVDEEDDENDENDENDEDTSVSWVGRPD